MFFLQGFFLPTTNAFASLPPGNTSFKKGVGYADRGTRNQMRALGVSWSYPWYIKPEAFAVPEFGHVPMIWDENYNANVVGNVARDHPGSSWLIWNEPDLLGKANIAPSAAALIYRTLRPLIKGADPTAKLIVGGTSGLNSQWLSGFRSSFFNLTGQWPVVEGWHSHYYVGGSEFYNQNEWRRKLNDFKNWMTNNGGMVEFWLTEFGCLNCWGDAGQIKMRLIMTDQIPWLENQSWINRYAWFATKTLPFMTGELLTETGLTSLGQHYATFGQAPSCLDGNLGNLDCDALGLINILDLNILLSSWSPNGPVPSPPAGRPSADLVLDGKVDILDLNKLLGNWRAS